MGIFHDFLLVDSQKKGGIRFLYMGLFPVLPVRGYRRLL